MSDWSALKSIPAFIKDPICTKNWFYTNAKKFEHEFTWIIKDYNSQVPHIRQNRLKSPTFSAANDSCKWLLEPSTGHIIRNGIYVDFLYLNLKMIPIKSSSGPISGSFTAALINSQNQKCNNFHSQFFKDNKTDRVCSEPFISCSSLKNELLPEGELRIYIKISYIRDTITVSNHFPQELDGSNLTDDFEKLLNDEDSSDVIIDVNGKKYPAHKTILTARSPVFKAMFQHDMTESRQNCIEIKDIDEQIFPEVLRYIYTGKVENLNDTALELVLVAEKYDLVALKNACLHALSALLSEDTAVKILILAELNGAQCLKTQAIEYIRAMNMIDVMKSEGWEDLSCNPDLMKCLVDP